MHPHARNTQENEPDYNLEDKDVHHVLDGMGATFGRRSKGVRASDLRPCLSK